MNHMASDGVPPGEGKPGQKYDWKCAKCGLAVTSPLPRPKHHGMPMRLVDPPHKAT